MKSSELNVGDRVVIKGMKTSPATFRCAEVLSITSYTAEVRYLYGVNINEELIRWNPGLKTPIYSKGQTGKTKWNDILRKAKNGDLERERREWADISEALKLIEALQASGKACILSSEYPPRIEVMVDVENAKKLLA